MMQVQWCVQSLRTIAHGPSRLFQLLFLFQSPDKKKVLTTQRTFDSEGELKHPGFFFPRSV